MSGVGSRESGVDVAGRTARARRGPTRQSGSTTRTREDHPGGGNTWGSLRHVFPKRRPPGGRWAKFWAQKDEKKRRPFRRVGAPFGRAVGIDHGEEHGGGNMCRWLKELA